MMHMKTKKEPWRIAVACVSVIFIVALLTFKSINGMIDTVPNEQLLPMVATNVAVTMFKVLIFTGIVWAVRRIGKLLTQKK